MDLIKNKAAASVTMDDVIPTLVESDSWVPKSADFYFTEIGFRWYPRIVAGSAVRRTRKGREVIRTLRDRIPPAQQFITQFSCAVGRQLRRTKDGSIAIKSAVAAFG